MILHVRGHLCRWLRLSDMRRDAHDMQSEKEQRAKIKFNPCFPEKTFIGHWQKLMSIGWLEMLKRFHFWKTCLRFSSKQYHWHSWYICFINTSLHDDGSILSSGISSFWRIKILEHWTSDTYIQSVCGYNRQWFYQCQNVTRYYRGQWLSQINLY